jgi:N-methylhydantoinase A
MLLGVDVGGTFTDAVLVAGGRVHTAKTPTTPEDESRGVLAAAAAVLERAGAEASAVRAFAHGMTVATNALLEGRGARTALVATEGFTDVVELGRQARADLYHLCRRHPAPLAPPELRFAAPERMGPDGPLRPLRREEAAPMLAALADARPEAIAVVLLHSYANPAHELELAALISERLPGVHVSLSHELVGTFREFERAATTEVDAALSPLLAGYLRRLCDRAAELGLPEPAVMQSSGGVTDAERAGAHAALTVLSGPAGGAAAAALVAGQSGVRDALCFDMGGTSCDVCVVADGAVSETGAATIGGRPLALPMVDIHTVGAGGGSIAWRDAGGALRVGPQSAGADPGPACYGRGGEEATVTDANLLLGRLDAGAPLAGGVALDADAARAAIERLARELGLDTIACAEGILRVANAEMLRALRVMTVERGVDPRGFALLAFGGAGPLHAAAIAEELGIERVLCPRTAGVLSALGLAAAERRSDAQRSVMLAGAELRRDAIAAATSELAQAAKRALGADDARLRVDHELRYRGQSFELTVSTSAAGDPDELRSAFEAAHAERYGFANPDGEIELVTLRVVAQLPGAELDLSPPPATQEPPRSRRAVVFDGVRRETEILTEAPAPGATIAAPAIVALPESTVVIPPGWRGTVDRAGTLVLDRGESD